VKKAIWRQVASPTASLIWTLREGSLKVLVQELKCSEPRA
jgi:hypothetical protein